MTYLKLTISLLGIVILAWAMVACENGNSAPGTDTASDSEHPDNPDLPYELAESELSRDIDPDVAPANLTALTADNRDFAFDFYKLLREDEEMLASEDGNLFFSPHSISTALAMTFAGAKGETQTAMADTMHFDLTPEELHPAFNKLDLELESRSEDVNPDEEQPPVLEIANSLWGRSGSHFEQDFLDTIAVNYGGKIRMLPFGQDPTGEAAIMNGWVEEKTNDKIKDLIPPALISEDLRLVLLNAIYFKAAWKLPFQESTTSDGNFNNLDGTVSVVPMMHADSAEYLDYVSAENYQAVELPFAGEKLAMTFIMPHEGQFETVEASLEGDGFDQIIDSLEENTVQVHMPRFKIEFKAFLRKLFEGTAMAIAFENGDFSGMCGAQANCEIGEIIHQSFIDVNEKGVEAAAATAVLMYDTAMPEYVNLTIDRPFIFAIRDRETGAVLFLGRVVNL